jgi:hypothetical protein
MKNIHESLSKLLLARLGKYKKENKKLNKETCIAIYQDIFETTVQLFQSADIKICNESMNLISQMYYDSIQINENQELDPNIFSQRASLLNIETKELALLASFFTNTPFAEPFIFEIKKRS